MMATRWFTATLGSTLLVLGACGGSAKSAATPAPDACSRAADNAVRLAAELLDPTRMSDASAALAQSCRETAWSTEATTCLAAMPSLMELGSCSDLLSKSQNEAASAVLLPFQRPSSSPEGNPMAAPPPPPPPPPPPGGPRGGLGDGANPCEGGEANPCEGGE